MLLHLDEHHVSAPGVQVRRHVLDEKNERNTMKNTGENEDGSKDGEVRILRFDGEKNRFHRHTIA